MLSLLLSLTEFIAMMYNKWQTVAAVIVQSIHVSRSCSVTAHPTLQCRCTCPVHAFPASVSMVAACCDHTQSTYKLGRGWWYCSLLPATCAYVLSSSFANTSWRQRYFSSLLLLFYTVGLYRNYFFVSHKTVTSHKNSRFGFLIHIHKLRWYHSHFSVGYYDSRCKFGVLKITEEKSVVKTNLCSRPIKIIVTVDSWLM